MVASSRTWHSAILAVAMVGSLAATRGGRARRRTVRMDITSKSSEVRDGRTSHPSASSSSRTRRRRSPTPRSGCGRLPAGWPLRTARADNGASGAASQ